MRLASTAAATGMAGIVLAAVPFTAAAETTPALHTVTVQGVGEVPISASADQATAIAAYRAGMAAAVADGLSKAQFLAAQVGTTVDSPGVSPGIVEGSGYINCPSEVEYSGHQPDWGFGGGFISAAPTAAVKAPHPPTVHHKKKTKKKHHVAKKAASPSCTLSTGVSITYVLN
jgi:hypothetical protein